MLTSPADVTAMLELRAGITGGRWTRTTTPLQTTIKDIRELEPQSRYAARGRKKTHICAGGDVIPSVFKEMIDRLEKTNHPQ